MYVASHPSKIERGASADGRLFAVRHSRSPRMCGYRRILAVGDLRSRWCGRAQHPGAYHRRLGGSGSRESSTIRAPARAVGPRESRLVPKTATCAGEGGGARCGSGRSPAPGPPRHVDSVVKTNAEVRNSGWCRELRSSWFQPNAKPAGFPRRSQEGTNVTYSAANLAECGLDLSRFRRLARTRSQNTAFTPITLVVL
jgi:hypothetical protein